MKHFVFIPLCLLLITGCSTTSRQVTYDNTVQVVKRPVSGTAEFGWRVKTFWQEEVVSFWRRHVSFRTLKMQEVPVVGRDRGYMDRDIMAKWLEKKTGAPTKGRLELLLNGDRFFPHFTDAINSAESHIDLKTYIFDNDDVAKEYADLLKQRSSEVRIRILYDLLGTTMAWGAHADSLPEGYEYEVDNMIEYLAEDSSIELRRARHTLLTSEHSKYIIINNTVAYFGGMNIGREYRYDWRDAMFALYGPIIDELNIRFDIAWALSRGDDISRLKLPKIEIAETGADRDIYLAATTPFKHHIYKGQLRAIKNAKHHIYIENPYLWNQSIIYQLCAARKRGVDVRVTIPRDVNHSIGMGANKYTVKRLLDHGVRVFIYPGMTHVKAAVYDQWACVGSANFDDLSLHKNYELNLFTDNPDAVRQVEHDLLLAGQQASEEVFDAEKVTFTDRFSARVSQYL